jgi:hypothetical protein
VIKETGPRRERSAVQREPASSAAETGRGLAEPRSAPKHSISTSDNPARRDLWPLHSVCTPASPMLSRPVSTFAALTLTRQREGLSLSRIASRRHDRFDPATPATVAAHPRSPWPPCLQTACETTHSLSAPVSTRAFADLVVDRGTSAPARGRPAKDLVNPHVDPAGVRSHIRHTDRHNAATRTFAIVSEGGLELRVEGFRLVTSSVH